MCIICELISYIIRSLRGRRKGAASSESGCKTFCRSKRA